MSRKSIRNTDDAAASTSSSSARLAKRIVDLALGIVMSVLTLPVVVVGVLLAAASFRAWPFFVQVRVGRWGRPIRVVKIRSLPVDAPRAADKYQLAEVHNTGIGRWLRRLHIDELPQLWLVVAGSMSLVGPRPEMPHLAERFSDAQRAARASFRPGCVGLWQTSVHNGGLMSEHPEYDLVYERSCSVALDLYLLFAAVRMVCRGQRLQLADVQRRLLHTQAEAPERELVS